MILSVKKVSKFFFHPSFALQSKIQNKQTLGNSFYLPLKCYPKKVLFLAKYCLKKHFSVCHKSSDGKVQENVKKFRFQTGMFTFLTFISLQSGIITQEQNNLQWVFQRNIGSFRISEMSLRLKHYYVQRSAISFTELQFQTRVVYLRCVYRWITCFPVTAGYQFYLLDSYHCSTSKRNCKAATL